MTAWRITLDHDTAFVAGSKSEARRRIAACGDRSPLWVPRRLAWATTPDVARKVLDQLDARRITYTLEDSAQLGLSLTIDHTIDYNEPAADPVTPNWSGVRYRAKDIPE